MRDFMPEELDDPVETLSEHIHEAAHHAKENWLRWSALLSALFAVLAAVSGLQSAHYANDAMIEQIEASDQWGYYQAKGTKALIKESEARLLAKLGETNLTESEQQLKKYRQEQQDIKADAEHKIALSRQHLERHEILSRAVTLFQVAIAIIAITLLTKRRRFLLFSIGAACLGLYFFINSFFLG
jgi:hypothetical protein